MTSALLASFFISLDFIVKQNNKADISGHHLLAVYTVYANTP